MEGEKWRNKNKKQSGRAKVSIPHRNEEGPGSQRLKRRPAPAFPFSNPTPILFVRQPSCVVKASTVRLRRTTSSNDRDRGRELAPARDSSPSPFGSRVIVRSAKREAAIAAVGVQTKLPRHSRFVDPIRSPFISGSARSWEVGQGSEPDTVR